MPRSTPWALLPSTVEAPAFDNFRLRCKAVPTCKTFSHGCSERAALTPVLHSYCKPTSYALAGTLASLAGAAGGQAVTGLVCGTWSRVS